MEKVVHLLEGTEATRAPGRGAGAIPDLARSDARTEIASGLIVSRGDERVRDDGKQFGQVPDVPGGAATARNVSGRG